MMGAHPDASATPVWREALLASATVLLLVVIRWQFVGIPLERDEGSYALLGERLVAGLRPYVDFYDHRPPGFFLFYGLMVRLLGYDYMQLQRGFCLVFGLILLFSHGFLRRLVGVRVALAVLPVYGLALLNPQLCGFTIQSEFVVLLFGSLGLWLVAEGMRGAGSWTLIAAGASLGASVLVKEVGVFYCACATLWLLSALDEVRGGVDVARMLAAFGAGIAGALAAALLWVYARGVLPDAMFWVVEYPRKYYLGLVSFTDGLGHLRSTAWTLASEQPTFWLLGVVGLFCGMLLSASPRAKLRLYALVLCAFCTVVPGFLFLGHYWILLVPGLAAAIAMAYRWLDERLGRARKALVAAIFVLVPASNLAASRGYYLHPDFDDVLHATYGSNPFPEMKVVGDYLNARLRPGDQIFVAGSEPELYVYTKTTGVTRHTFIEFLSLPSPYAREWQAEVIADVAKAQPRFVVKVLHPFSWELSPQSDRTLYEWVQHWVPQHYGFVFIADQVEPEGRSVFVAAKDHPDYRPQGATGVDVWERNEP